MLNSLQIILEYSFIQRCRRRNREEKQLKVSHKNILVILYLYSRYYERFTFRIFNQNGENIIVEPIFEAKLSAYHAIARGF